ncbi:MAG TPA: sigma-70 family RNA polymerase sigma factor [Verrucomicrobiae bacterium]|nr:sigma-70 family RNA polymerase sigma factor [Verrucomicrobiae bacterium]
MNVPEAASEGRQALFSAWLSEHVGLVFKVARAFAPADADRRDLIQDILLQLWCSLPRFEGRAKVSTWIYRVAFNTALAWRRKETKHRAPQIPLIEVEELPGAEEDTARRLDQEQIVAHLYSAIHQLPKVDAALVLLYLDDLSYREMAEVLGISENHVGVKLNRARKALAELMKEVTYEP